LGGFNYGNCIFHFSFIVTAVLFGMLLRLIPDNEVISVFLFFNEIFSLEFGMRVFSLSGRLSFELCFQAIC